MKKKNVIGHMVASKESAKSRFRKLKLLPRLLCLLAAIVIWLLVVDTIESRDLPKEPNLPITEYTEG